MRDTCRLIYIFSVIVFVVGFVNCKAKKADVTAKTTEPSETNVPVSKDTKQKLVFGSFDKNKNKSSGQPEQQVLSDLDSGDISSDLLTVFSRSDIVPEDMIIGALENYKVLEDDEKQLYDRIKHFFTALSKGELDKKAIHPLWRENLLRILDKVTLTEEFSLRIGIFVYDEEGIDIKIRIITPESRSSGEVLSEKSEGTWLLSDISMNFNLLKERYVKKENRFEPDSYMNLRLEY